MSSGQERARTRLLGALDAGGSGLAPLFFLPRGVSDCWPSIEVADLRPRPLSLSSSKFKSLYPSRRRRARCLKKMHCRR